MEIQTRCLVYDNKQVFETLEHWEPLGLAIVDVFKETTASIIIKMEIKLSTEATHASVCFIQNTI